MNKRHTTRARDKWSSKEENVQKSETTDSIAIRKHDITETVHYDNDSKIMEAVAPSRSAGNKATNEESDNNDEYWETITHIDEEEVI